MFSGFTALATALALTSALASDWHFADADAKGHNITFVDKGSIRTNAAGNTEATIFSVLAADSDGVSAFRYVAEFQCAAGKFHPVTGEMFDATLKSDGPADMAVEWQTVEPGKQGDTIFKFVCSKGASQPDSKSLGDALPLAAGRAMLAERAAKKAQ